MCFFSSGKSFSLNVYFLKNWPNPEKMFNTSGLIYVKQRLRPNSTFKPETSKTRSHTFGQGLPLRALSGQDKLHRTGTWDRQHSQHNEGQFQQEALMSRRWDIPPEAGDPLLISLPQMVLCRSFPLRLSVSRGPVKADH